VSEPRRSRPAFGPSYGISTEEDGMLDWQWADQRLASSRNYWVASTDSDGRPSVTPVWGVWMDGAVHFGTNVRSRKAQNIERNARVVIHLESGDDVVILHGEVERFVLNDAIADAYNEKYDYRPDPDETSGEGWYRLRPRRALAWLERDYPKTATRFDFDR
jgi:pyridoxine/pyridoxamine 5'-phosphate oxidase